VFRRYVDVFRELGLPEATTTALDAIRRDILVPQRTPFMAMSKPC
jgi:hypothetical protein